MRLFSRPSHYQISFLVIFLGVTWGITGGQLRQKKGATQSTKAHRGFVQLLTEKAPGPETAKDLGMDFEGRTLGESLPGQVAPALGATERGTPLAGVKLELVPLGKGAHSSQGILSLFSGNEGEFRFKGLLPGRYILRALPRDGKHLSKAIALEIPRKKPDTSTNTPLGERTLVLPFPRKMLGKVLRKSASPEGGQDRKHFWISVSENGLHRGTAQTDPKGNFHIDSVGKGPYDFTLRDQDGEVLPVQEVSQHTDPEKHSVLVSLITP